MRHIKKGRQPAPWLRFCKQREPEPRFDDGPKEALRTALLAEQGHLCCYCMNRIRDEFRGMKIEHWAPRGQHPELDYGNLLAACVGGDGGPRRDQHCDTAKADQPIELDPRSRECERRVCFTVRGEAIAADPADEGTERDLRVLNLNHPRLEAARAAVLEEVHRWAGRHGGSRTSRSFEERIAFLETPDENGRLKPFVGVATAWLRRQATKR